MSTDFLPPPNPGPNGGPSKNTTLIIIAAACVGGFCVCCGPVSAILLPAINAAREVGRKSVCMEHETEIATAIKAYEKKNGRLPPPYEADAAGKPQHSWRVLLLPYFNKPELDALYAQYDLKEPWDSPHNSLLADKMPSIYRCPSSRAAPGTPSYLAIVGDTTAWPHGKPLTLDDISKLDGVSYTILLAEVADAGFNWLEPRDLSLVEAAQKINQSRTGLCISSSHPRGAAVVFCDGHYRFLAEEVSPQMLRNLLTATGHDIVDESQY